MKTGSTNAVQCRRKLKRGDGAAPWPKFAEVVVRAEADAVAALTIELPGDVVLAAALIKEITRGSAGC